MLIKPCPSGKKERVWRKEITNAVNSFDARLSGLETRQNAVEPEITKLWERAKPLPYLKPQVTEEEVGQAVDVWMANGGLTLHGVVNHVLQDFLDRRG